jgi:hypothetical protein
VLGQDDEDYDAAEIDRDLIASRLQHDVVSYELAIRNKLTGRPKYRARYTTTSRQKSARHRSNSSLPLVSYPPLPL